MAPGEGSPTAGGGAGWLIPNAFGTLPTDYKEFDIVSAFLCLDLFFTVHGRRTSLALFAENACPGALIAFSMFLTVIVWVIVLREPSIEVICMTNVVATCLFAAKNIDEERHC